MTHQVNITLTDNEYYALSAEAHKDEEMLEEFLHHLLTRYLQISPFSKHSLNAHEVSQYLYLSGLAENIPTGAPPETPEEAAERRHLAELFGQVEPGGKLASEMVIEDRGPRE